VRDQVSHPYKTFGRYKIRIYTMILSVYGILCGENF
jgi:hypothetical protein